MSTSRYCWLVVWLVVLTATSDCLWAAAPKRVLILDSFGRDIAPFNVAVASLRTTLVREFGEPVDMYEASLDPARFAEPEKETRDLPPQIIPHPVRVN